MKRFYDEVGTQRAESGWQVTLDGRGLKTVKGSPQIVPGERLARELAGEWDQQPEELDPKTFVLRDMADYAIDIVAPDPASVADQLTAYGDTDTLLYRADPDEPLHERQQEVWEPIVGAFEAREGVEFARISGIVHQPQPPGTLDVLRGRLASFNPFMLAGIESMTALSASLIVGLSASVDTSEPLELWQAASLEEEWQADLWGRDYEAEERRAKRQADFLKASEFTRLSRVQG